MNSATRSTLLMLVLAAASVFVAIAYYPWPVFTEIDTEVGKPLFEEYSADKVRGIDIIKFNSDYGALDRITLVRHGEKWVVPAKQNFVASESQRIGAVINSLNEKTVYQVMSENQEDHIEYGVVDPAQYAGEKNVASLGKKIVLTDRNDKTIAELIIGLPLKDDPNKRYVRKPGKPRVYTIDFGRQSMQSLSTDFALWVSPNVLGLQLQTEGPGRQIRSIQIDNYQMIATEKGSTTKESIYKANLKPADKGLIVESLLVPIEKASDEWSKLSTTPAQRVNLTNSVRSLIFFFVDDVRRKSNELGEAMKNPSADTPDTVFAGLSGLGFFKTVFDEDRWLFDSKNGQVSVSSGDGVITTISIGEVGGANSMDNTKLNHFVMINSSVDYDYLKEPTRPAGLENDESDENRQFLRIVKDWSNAVKNAKQQAFELNAIHGDWFYLVGDDILNNLRPDLTLPSVLPKTRTDDPETQKDPGDTDQEEHQNTESAKDPTADDK